MSSYQTKYSNLNNFNKKERKIKTSNFPWIAPNSNLSGVDWCGQKVSKQDMGSNIKFCPLCDHPMIVRIKIIPCEHVICYSCSKPDSESCYICEASITQLIRIADKQKLYECDFPDCFKFYESIDQLNLHKCFIHNQQMGFDPNIMKQDLSVMNPLNNQRIPNINFQSNIINPQISGYSQMMNPMGNIMSVPMNNLMGNQTINMMNNPMSHHNLP